MDLTGETARAFARASSALARATATARVARKREKIEQLVEFDLAAGAERLDRLLAHAVERVPFYRGRDIPVGRSLTDFPMVRKADLRAGFPDFISRRSNGRMEQGTYFINETSGSTGQPLRTLATVETGGIMNAAIHERINRHLGVAEGGITLNVGLQYSGPTPLFEPEALPRATVRCNLRGFDPGEIEVAQAYEATVGLFPVEKISGTSSRIVTLARYCAERGISLRPKAIIATYEHMPDSGRALVEKTFGCAVTMLYATSETGYSAWECDRRNLHFQDDLVFPEIVPDGGTGIGDIVLTNLLSTPMPIIRYLTGDRATEPIVCGCGLPGTAIANLVGRTRTSLVGADRELYSPFALMGALAAAGLPDFQIIQETPGMVELIVPAASSQTDEVMRVLNSRLVEVFAPRRGFRLRLGSYGRFVLTESGKRNPVVQYLDFPPATETSGYLIS
ncbi:Phenylacetate-coenzyme A ligase PaaK, adenylate-forming domain family [Amycolatopsis xylanica]|uniref:Phenylacetate-coenzyme A ligase PaaK, adenylate-forming domain family n=1 Tax=Amycolatopsis xylanica TaxID=589385 RepID=A0A1H2TDU1_9PSEU|nr:phenylacetate--CoA ligase family protein [Amycolatopsis xylanica]SDW42000.1 Phenylacetate-coenzyme A ligase PaaK, adenylate-forming domain family [Amycolatopsis xylanica]